MARKPRYHRPGAFYHVMLRGNNGQNIFFDDADRCQLCLLIQHGTEKYGYRVHAFCFMTNHVHLLLQVGHVHLSKLVHNLAFRYSQYINKRYDKVGHLFQGRFKAILLEEANYFLRLVRYIHMNPVRSKLVNSPENYSWSGHNAYLGQVDITWLTTEYGLSKFESIMGLARRFYSDFVLKAESQEDLNELRFAFKDGQVLGDDAFLAGIRGVSEQENLFQGVSLLRIIDAACEIFEIDQVLLVSPSQSRKASLARSAIVMHAQEKGVTLEDLAVFFKRDSSTLSSLLSRFFVRYQQCDQLKRQLQTLREKSDVQLADLQA